MKKLSNIIGMELVMTLVLVTTIVITSFLVGYEYGKKVDQERYQCFESVTC